MPSSMLNVFLESFNACVIVYSGLLTLILLLVVVRWIVVWAIFFFDWSWLKIHNGVVLDNSKIVDDELRICDIIIFLQIFRVMKESCASIHYLAKSSWFFNWVSHFVHCHWYKWMSGTIPSICGYCRCFDFIRIHFVSRLLVWNQKWIQALVLDN